MASYLLIYRTVRHVLFTLDNNYQLFTNCDWVCNNHTYVATKITIFCAVLYMIKLVKQILLIYWLYL